jgi:4'-phosphopantetheinyl transferase
MVEALSCPRAGEICVWHASTADAWSDRERVERALSWLSIADRARYERYRNDSDRDMFLLGRTMARALVGRAIGVGPHDWEWREGERGRPEIADPAAPLSFNLAHSAGLVVCALSRDGDVGTDVEYRHRPPLDPQIVRRFCSPTEIQDIERGGAGDWRDRFLKYWTLKEAYLKARGLGIAVPLADVSFSLDDDEVRVTFLNSLAGTDTNWAFALNETDPHHFIAVAAPAPGPDRPQFVIEPMPADLLP